MGSRGELVRQKILDCIVAWQSDGKHSIFSWVDDMMINYIPDSDFCYYLHELWVCDWTYSGRVEEMDVFLQEWVTDDKIKDVQKRVEDWKAST